MNKVAIIPLLLLIIIQCKNPEKKADEKTLPYTVLSEELKPYQLTQTDTVYSASIKLLANDSVLIKYWVQLLDEKDMYKDSIYFSLRTSEKTAGEIIFPNCKFHANKKPSFKSKIEVVE